MRGTPTPRGLGRTTSCISVCVIAALLVACDDDGTSCVDMSCPDHQTCMMVDGSATCVCDDGYRGDECDECETGYTMNADGDCMSSVFCGAGSCSGHGSCDDSSGAAVCTCETGYTGASCDACDDGYEPDGDDCAPSDNCDDDPCGAHGTCDDTSGVVTCTCEAGYGGDFCDACAAGYHDDGTGLCVADEACGTNTCNGHGTCDDTTGAVVCTCTVGWAGAHCDECDDGYHLDTDECVPDDVCPVGYCNEHGACRVVDGSAVCECEVGYGGDRCDECADPDHEVNPITGLCELPCDEGPFFIRCGDECVEAISQENCGGCGVDCGDGWCEFWESATPECVCYDETCDGICVDLQRNEEHCGECDNSCDTSADEVCFLGTCQPTSTECEDWCEEEWGICCPDGHCLYWEEAWMDPMNCGGCGIVCSDDEVCVMGSCMGSSDVCDPECREEEICCETARGGECIFSWDFGWNPDHCGGCGIECLAGEWCEEGSCICPEPSIRCGGSCTNVEFDNANCGECGVVCDLAAGERCTFGICEAGSGECSGCSATQICCENHSGTTPEYECVDVWGLDRDSEHCGGCDPCALGEECQGGVCQCPGFFSDYCGDPPVCTDLWTEENCGECGNECLGDAYCEGEWWPGPPTCVCPYTVCPDGVCTDLMRNEEHCGECGDSCEEGEMCATGNCVSPTSDECRECWEDSICCEDPLWEEARCVSDWEMQWDRNHCGGCGIQCGDGEMCIDGECRVPPGDSCDDPADAFRGMEGNLCEFTDTGEFPVGESCEAVDVGAEAFYSFTAPFPGDYFMWFGTEEEFPGTLVVYRADPDDSCTPTETILCITPYGEAVLSLEAEETIYAVVISESDDCGYFWVEAGF